MKAGKDRKSKESQCPLGVLLSEPLKQIQQKLMAELADWGFSEIRPTHFPVVDTLDGKEMRLTSLASCVGVTKQTVSYIVDDLERLGYVKCGKDPSDGRAKIVKLSDKGIEARRSRTEIMKNIDEEWTKALGTKEMKRLVKLLEKLTRI